MRNRCTNPRHRSFKDYGARGIGIDDPRWHSYEAFLENMGRRPTSQHSLHRIDNDKGYCKANCIWATWGEQNHPQNKRPHDRSGERCPTAKLTRKEVAKIRRLAPRHSQGSIARRFGVSDSTVSDILTGRTWRNSEDAAALPKAD
jgi:hypothetical protein